MLPRPEDLAPAAPSEETDPLEAIPEHNRELGQAPGTDANVRRLTLIHPHSGEAFDDIYWADGDYVRPALQRLDWLLRDRNRGSRAIPIDPSLFDLLHDLNQEIGNTEPLHLVSGYRTVSNPPRSRKNRRGKAITGRAWHSMHVDGKAIDIRMPGQDLRQVRGTAIAMARGGVGFYGPNAHLHLDVGPVRHWG